MTNPFHNIDKLAGDWFQCEHCGKYVKGTPENTSHKCENRAKEKQRIPGFRAIKTNGCPKGMTAYDGGAGIWLFPDFKTTPWTDDITPEE